MSRVQTPIRRNDTVSINTGKDNGKRGRICRKCEGVVDK